MGPVDAAERFADGVLFPAALATDAAAVVPSEILDALGDAGLYAAGAEDDIAVVAGVEEALAGGCLTTAFLWAQHIGLVHAVKMTHDEAVRSAWLESLLRGDVRAGLALGGAAPEPTLHTTETSHGWVLDGTSPFLSGWGVIDVVHTAARVGDEVVWLIVDAVESSALRVRRLELVALNATATVRATFDGLVVPADRLIARHPAGAETPPVVYRLHAGLALGVAARCCRLIGASPLDEELSACRAELDRLDPETSAVERGHAGELAVRAAAALMTTTGSRSLLLADHAQRLAREALFTLVYALRPASRDAAVSRLVAT
jgi:alkylation response protein AidB-like acyl-CoA dehydrogenase